MGKNFNADSFDFEKEFENISKTVVKPNILICGATGAGKSSFINEVFGKNVARVGTGLPVTRGVKRYEDNELSVVLYDSEGYEIGGQKQEYFKDEILGVIDKYKNENLEDISRHIHEVWYFISAANKRVTDTDIELIKKIQDKGVPIAIAITQIDNVDEEELRNICRAVDENIKNVQYFTVCVANDKEILEAVKIYNQKEDLIEWALENLEDTLQTGFILSLYGNLKLVKKYVRNKIITIYTGSAAVVAVTPIPFSDATLLTPIQFKMSTHIMKAYGIDRISGAVTSLVNSMIISQVGKVVASTLAGNLLKLIPTIGSVAGLAVNTTVATTITVAIGYGISEMCYRYSKAVIDGNNVDLEEFFNSNLLKELISSYGRN